LVSDEIDRKLLIWKALLYGSLITFILSLEFLIFIYLKYLRPETMSSGVLLWFKILSTIAFISIVTFLILYLMYSRIVEHVVRTVFEERGRLLTTPIISLLLKRYMNKEK